jgi:hypothetical protein
LGWQALEFEQSCDLLKNNLIIVGMAINNDVEIKSRTLGGEHLILNKREIY